MHTRRIMRPTLADLWKYLLATLEGLGVEDAPTLARSLAVSGLTGLPIKAMGVRVRHSGEVVIITSTGTSLSAWTSVSRQSDRGRPARRRSKIPVGC